MEQPPHLSSRTELTAASALAAASTSRPNTTATAPFILPTHAHSVTFNRHDGRAPAVWLHQHMAAQSAGAHLAKTIPQKGVDSQFITSQPQAYVWMT